ncbi:hypothetical protein ACIA8O_20105 [Kitasatospora sp. NPDC051853]|uniref:hypothetical protein n=1 Tax=Kitasatospora sp. NPDC051853 TaxID=3364058 RepID=UPI003798F957
MLQDVPSQNLPAPRTRNAASTRQEFAERLKRHFHQLGVSYRVYGKEHHIPAPTLSRYLNGQRDPGEQFLASLFEQLAAAGRPVDASDQARLRDLHTKSFRRGGHAQVASLQAELEDCLRDHQELSAQLADLKDALEEADTRLKAVRRQRDLSSAARLRVQRERDALQERVNNLQNEILVLRAWVISLVARLERLERLRIEEEMKERTAGTSSVSDLLAGTDRTPVDELVRLVSDSEDRHRPVATELVRAACRSRPAPEVATLLLALHQAEGAAQVISALPGTVRERSLTEAVNLLCSLVDRQLYGYVGPALQAFASTHSDSLLLTLLVHLHDRSPGLQAVTTITGASMRFLRGADVVVLLVDLNSRPELRSALELCLGNLARWRSDLDLLQVTELLARYKRLDLANRLTDRVLEELPAPAAADFLASLTGRCLGPVLQVHLDRLLRTGPPRRAAAVLCALPTEIGLDRLAEAGYHPLVTRRIVDVVEFVAALDLFANPSHGTRLVLEYLRSRPEAEARELALRIDAEVMRMLARTAKTLESSELRALTDLLDRLGFREIGVRLLHRAAKECPPPTVLALLRSSSQRSAEYLSAVLDGVVARGAEFTAEMIAAPELRRRPETLTLLVGTAERSFPPEELREAQARSLRAGLGRPGSPVTTGHAPLPLTPLPVAAEPPASVPELLGQLTALREEVAVLKGRLAQETARRTEAEARLGRARPSMAPLGG